MGISWNRLIRLINNQVIVLKPFLFVFCRSNKDCLKAVLQFIKNAAFKLVTYFVGPTTPNFIKRR